MRKLGHQVSITFFKFVVKEVENGITLQKLENKSLCDLLAEKELMLDLHSNFRSIKRACFHGNINLQRRERARIP